jgi:hypothetical protein
VRQPPIKEIDKTARDEGEEMTGRHPAGLPWTRGEEDQLRVMLEAGMKTPAIALKLRRTVSAVRTRKTILNRREELKAKGK